MPTTRPPAVAAPLLPWWSLSAPARPPQMDVRRVRGVDVLRSLLKDHGLSGADLSRMLGASRSLGPMILRGERSLTAEHARVLRAHFYVDPGVFIR